MDKRLRFKLQMVVYGLIIVILILAFIFVNVYRSIQDKEKDSYCTTTVDCEKLVHAECTGSWICVSNACAWRCNLNETSNNISAGGLSGSTVECIEDSNCAAGVCPDGYQYQKSACMSNKCYDLQYFADPCMGHY